jgi:signal transduction histidine kinase
MSDSADAPPLAGTEIRRLLAQERERIGRDLHDSVIQDLYGVGLLLDAALDLIDDPRAADRVRTALGALDTSIRRLRSTIFVVSEPDPASPVAEQLARAASGRAGQLGFAPTVEVGVADPALPPEVIGELLQFVSEALANVARHAAASSATVRLDAGPDGGWSLSVADDGRGFDPATVQAGMGLGTLGRRAALLGARFTVNSAPGRGTTVRITRIDPHRD